jgi:hypothetical protein
MYDFTLPIEIIKARKAELNRRALADQRQSRKTKAEYSFTRKEGEEFINTAVDVIDTVNITKPSSYYEMVVSLQLLCGRRNKEVMSTLQHEPGYNDYTALVWGLCKRDGIKKVDKVYIPLLCTYDKFTMGMNKLRRFYDSDQSTNNSRIGSSLARASVRVFNRKLTHSQKRNIYSEMCYLKRCSQSKFLIGEDSCSKTVWIAKCLCHSDPGVPSVTQRYQTMTMIDEQDNGSQ